MKAVEDIHIQYDKSGFSDKQLIDFYDKILLPRLIEEKMLILLRQGKISKWFSGFGQEAISVGTAMAMQEEEMILPMHRNLGVFTTRDIPLNKLFSQFQGKEAGFTNGRDRSFHFGTLDYNIVGMISHLGPQLGIADGVALAAKLTDSGQATLVFTGDGGASEGDFHEALNVAAVWDLPVIFTIENNGWGLSTPSNEQFRCESFVDKGPGYGMDAFSVDGNNILEVYEAINKIADSIRKKPRPFLLECKTFRIRGHEEASGTKYYPDGLIADWSKMDPVENYQRWLLAEGIISSEDVEQKKQKIKELINTELDKAYDQPEVVANIDKELGDVYIPHKPSDLAIPDDKEEIRFIDAVSQGLGQSMRKHDQLVIMGQDVADYGGVFKVTEGFVEEFGKERVRNTPLCESAIIGTALGLSLKGWKSVVEMQFADFVTCGFNQIVNNLAKIHYRWGATADVVVRMPTGAGVAAGPFHSQSNEAWFFHTPGLKIVYPAFPEEAKGLLNAAINDPNPVMYFEHKALYRSTTGKVAKEYFETEIGPASLVSTGNEVTIVTYGMGVHWALETTEEKGIEADIINLRTLQPIDYDSIFESVKKTGRVIILHEDCLTGGIGGEIAARITEHCFEYLDAPVIREGSLDTPVPFAVALENKFLPNERFKEKIETLLDY